MYKCQIREALVFEIVFQKGRNKKFDESEFDKGPWICIYMYGNAVDFNGHAIGIEGYHGHQWTSLDVHGYP